MTPRHFLIAFTVVGILGSSTVWASGLALDYGHCGFQINGEGRVEMLFATISSPRIDGSLDLPAKVMEARDDGRVYFHFGETVYGVGEWEGSRVWILTDELERLLIDGIFGGNLAPAREYLESTGAQIRRKQFIRLHPAR